MADQEQLVTGLDRDAGRDGWRWQLGVGRLCHGQGRRSYGEADAQGAAETSESGHASINSESKNVGERSSRNGHGPGCAGEKYWVVVALTSVSCARRTVSRGERGLVRSNG